MKAKTGLILTINCGSSSIKYKLFSFPSEKVITKGVIEHIGEAGAGVKDHHEGLKKVLDEILGSGISKDEISAIGHRVVHGGEEFIEPVLISAEVVRKIKELSKLAPLHNPANLEGIIACEKILKGVPQVAVFDTAFHSSIPEYAYIYALPYEYYQNYGVRRYGFHGTSHWYVCLSAAKKLKKSPSKVNLITCHLGNGCSVTAIKEGRSVDTSMGFTPLEGLVMGTRCGDIDPALVLYLQGQLKVSADQLGKIMNKESGLKGISGVSNDFRELIEARAKNNKRAALAIEIFKYRLLKYIGAYCLVLGKVDAIVFTGGIGENVKEIRDYVGQRLKRLLKNPPKIMVIPTDEELMIAKRTMKLLKRISKRGQ